MPSNNAAAVISKMDDPTSEDLGQVKIHFQDHAASPPSIEQDLSRVLDSTPDELRSRYLLQNIAGTGTEKLHEIGLRAREYEKLFQAWEELHLRESQDGVSFITDDIISRLHNLKSFQPGPSELAWNLHRYGTYRVLLAKLGQLLYPWTNPYFADHMILHSYFRNGGRGIVFTAGDSQAPFVITAILSLRKLGCTLPIEVMYLGDSDLGEEFQTELNSLTGVVTRDLSIMVNDEGWRLSGWAAKPFAILFSSFREALFIDADSLFFRNPESLFDDPHYTRTGALFFRDRLVQSDSKREWLQQLLPKPISKQVEQSRLWTGKSAHMQESGVIVVDKWRHFMALLVVCRMNGPERDGNQEEGKIGVYDMVYGDKETFWLGWELVGDVDYSFHPGQVAAMGVIPDIEMRENQHEQRQEQRTGPSPLAKAAGSEAFNADDQHQIVPRDETGHHSYRICSPQLLHLDLNDRPLWFNGWLLENKFAAREEQIFAKFRHYLIEPAEGKADQPWSIEANNTCCLIANSNFKRDLNAEEMNTLGFIINYAKTV